MKLIGVFVFVIKLFTLCNTRLLLFWRWTLKKCNYRDEGGRRGQCSMKRYRLLVSSQIRRLEWALLISLDPALLPLFSSFCNCNSLETRLLLFPHSPIFQERVSSDLFPLPYSVSTFLKTFSLPDQTIMNRDGFALGGLGLSDVAPQPVPHHPSRGTDHNVHALLAQAEKNSGVLSLQGEYSMFGKLPTNPNVQEWKKRRMWKTWRSWATSDTAAAEPSPSANTRESWWLWKRCHALRTATKCLASWWTLTLSASRSTARTSSVA